MEKPRHQAPKFTTSFHCPRTLLFDLLQLPPSIQNFYRLAPAIHFGPFNGEQSIDVFTNVKDFTSKSNNTDGASFWAVHKWLSMQASRCFSCADQCCSLQHFRQNRIDRIPTNIVFQGARSSAEPYVGQQRIMCGVHYCRFQCTGLSIGARSPLKSHFSNIGPALSFCCSTDKLVCSKRASSTAAAMPAQEPEAATAHSQRAWETFRSWGSPQNFVAPMVDQVPGSQPVLPQEPLFPGERNSTIGLWDLTSVGLCEPAVRTGVPDAL